MTVHSRSSVLQALHSSATAFHSPHCIFVLQVQDDIFVMRDCQMCRSKQHLVDLDMLPVRSLWCPCESIRSALDMLQNKAMDCYTCIQRVTAAALLACFHHMLVLRLVCPSSVPADHVGHRVEGISVPYPSFTPLRGFAAVTGRQNHRLASFNAPSTPCSVLPASCQAAWSHCVRCIKRQEQTKLWAA